jgi:hypothetical protein
LEKRREEETLFQIAVTALHRPISAQLLDVVAHSAHWLRVPAHPA